MPESDAASVSALDRYRALADKVDAFFARVQARHGADLRCASGCSDCCRGGLTVTPVEAATIRALLHALPAPDRAALREAGRTRSHDAVRCVALDESGRCGIYAARPLVCRSHGVPVRLQGARGLPVVQACELNFTARGPAAAEPDCVLDQTTLSTVLAAIDTAWSAAQGLAPGTRIAIATLLAERA